MSKEVKARIKLRVSGGAATPAPPVGSALGPQGINMMEFCKQFNAQTAQRKGKMVPVVVTVYKDKTFSFIVKTPPASDLIKEKARIDKGSARPNTNKVGKITMADIEEIARIKISDLNALDVDQAKKMIAGTARSMGIEVIG